MGCLRDKETSFVFVFFLLISRQASTPHLLLCLTTTPPPSCKEQLSYHYLTYPPIPWKTRTGALLTHPIASTSFISLRIITSFAHNHFV